jgi:hypothetical protein
MLAPVVLDADKMHGPVFTLCRLLIPRGPYRSSYCEQANQGTEATRGSAYR